MGDDWLDIALPQNLSAAPAAPSTPVAVTLPTTYAERVALVEDCWSRLSIKQRTFLTALRENRFNARAANRVVNKSDCTNGSHTKWKSESDYATVLRVWRAIAAEGALDKDRLLARQDDIVETLLTPKPVLFQGVPVRDLRDPTGMSVLEEVEAGAAARANETLMKAAGLLKDKEVEVNVGLVGPVLQISVMQPNGELKDITPRGVTIDLPAPAASPEDIGPQVQAEDAPPPSEDWRS